MTMVTSYDFQNIGAAKKLINKYQVSECDKLVDTDEILRDKLVYTYENLMKRTAAADPILDEIRWKSFMSLSQQIVVISSREEPIDPDSNLPLFSHKVDQYFISENYYKSKEVLSFYNQVMVYINQYKSGLANILIAFEDIVALAQVEVGSND